jgi:hypothetical protein
LELALGDGGGGVALLAMLGCLVEEVVDVAVSVAVILIMEIFPKGSPNVGVDLG